MSNTNSNNSSDKNGLLWHYCSCASFLSILEKHSVRINDITKSNDRDELRLLINSCSSKLSEATSWGGKAFTIVLAFIKNLFEENTFIKTCEEASEQISIDNATKKSFEIITKDINKKIWSFSLSKKMNDLNMWRAYGDDGFGISLGFKESYLKNKLIKNLTENHIFANLFDVKYCTEPPSENRDSFIDQVVSIVKDDHLTEEEKKERYIFLSYEFAIKAARYKNKCFEDEEELRLVVSGEELNVENLIYEQFLEKNNKYISFLNLEIDLPEAIGFIYLGPKNPNSEVDIKRMLDFFLKKYDIGIEHSEIPYV